MDFLTRLINRSVVSSTGDVIGSVENFIIDSKWNVLSMIVKPSPKSQFRIPKDSDGKYIIPIANISAVREVIIVMNPESIRISGPI